VNGADAVKHEDALRLRMMEVLSELAVVPPVHIEGGPCVESAPKHEKFLEVAWGAGNSGEVTCPHCRVYINLMLPDDNGNMPTYTAAAHKLQELCAQPSEFAIQYRNLRRAHEKANKKDNKP